MARLKLRAVRVDTAYSQQAAQAHPRLRTGACRRCYHKDVADAALSMLEVDDIGLDSTDRRMLFSIINHFDGGSCRARHTRRNNREESITLEDVYEPYLLQLGFLNRTPRGRCATRLAYDHLNVPFVGEEQSQQQTLFE